MDFFNTLRDALSTSIKVAGSSVGEFIPKFFGAIAFIALGWIFGSAAGRVVAQLVTSLKADEALAKAGIDKLVEKAGYRLNSAAFIGWLVKVFFLVVFFMAAFDVLGLSQVNEFLKQILAYIPQVVIASIILFVASIVANILANLVSGASAALGTSMANFLAHTVRTAVWVFAGMIALSHLLGSQFAQLMQLLFMGVVFMFALAGGLAFGLGGKEAAAEMIRSMRNEVQK